LASSYGTACSSMAPKKYTTFVELANAWVQGHRVVLIGFSSSLTSKRASSRNWRNAVKSAAPSDQPYRNTTTCTTHCCGSDSAQLDFESFSSAFLAAYIGHCSWCPTEAFGLGVLSTSDPVLITTVHRIPPATNGGVALVLPRRCRRRDTSIAAASMASRTRTRC
jgi:hypothetical protein